MKKTLFLIVCLLTLVLPKAEGQQDKTADKLFSQGEYAQAQKQYAQLLKRSPRSALYLYRYARCAYELQEDSVAIVYFQKAGTRYPLRNFFLGELYLRQYCFEQAVTAYTDYIATLDEEHERYAYTQAKIQQAEKGARYLRRVHDIVITDSITLNKEDFLHAYPLSHEAGKIENLEGQTTYTNQRNDRRIRTLLKEDTLQSYLASEQRLLDGWSRPEVLPIEKDGSIGYPYVLADGITLYFASDSKDGLGGYDIYLTRYNAEQNTYLEPENLGFPFNSIANDYLLVIDEAKHRGYFASDRFAPKGKVTVYTFIPNDETRIVRSQNSAYIRAVAQAKTSRKVAETPTPTASEGKTVAHETPPTESHTSTKATTKKQTWQAEVQQQHATDAGFQFVVNDSIVYTQADAFQNPENKTRIAEWLSLQKELRDATEQLLADREKYKNAPAEERELLTIFILNNEDSIPTLKAAIQALEQQIREEENKALRQAKE